MGSIYEGGAGGVAGRGSGVRNLDGTGPSTGGGGAVCGQRRVRDGGGDMRAAGGG